MQEREPLTDHVTVAFIGGGFAGLVTGARLVEQGVTDVRIIEKGGDFGGTWYWNRYPGAQCDTASFVYMPLLEETGHMPTEKYAHGPEIYEHCQRIGKQYGLYDNALFHTEVTDLTWDDAASRWIISTNRGDRFTAQFLGMGTGPLHVPKLPGIEGVEDFQGHAFHTSRWDYAYTGGSPTEPMDQLADKKVAIIGTGATSVQCIPHLAKACGELYVFQRTPSSVDIRNNAPTDPEWFATINKPGWQKEWLENFTLNQTGGITDVDLVMDGWTDLSRRIKDKIFGLPPDQMTPDGMMAAFEDSDFEKMSEIRARVNEIVDDPDTAESLKAWYRQLCKRPCFHDEYLQAYNEPGVHPHRHRGQGRRAHHRARRGGGRRGVPGRLHHLRQRLRGGHPPGAAQRLRPHRPRRREALRVLGRRHAHPAGHLRARVPEPDDPAVHPGRQPDLQRAPQPHRERREHRHGDPSGDRQGRRPGGGDRRGRAGLARPPRHRHRAWASSAAPTAPPATTTTKASPTPEAGPTSSATPPAPPSTSATSTAGGRAESSRASSSGRRTGDGGGGT